MLSRHALRPAEILQQAEKFYRNRITRDYAKAKDPAPQKHCRLGSAPRNSRDPPDNFNPTLLSTNAFKLPPFIRPLAFRKFDRLETLGPSAHKLKKYKNPEYYSYHRYSAYDLMIAAAAVRDCNKSRKDMC